VEYKLRIVEHKSRIVESNLRLVVCVPRIGFSAKMAFFAANLFFDEKCQKQLPVASKQDKSRGPDRP
jgi:hypothetical protein